MNIAVECFISAVIKPALIREVAYGNTININSLLELQTVLKETGDFNHPLCTKLEYLYKLQ
jgi:hypothetical protein